MKLTLSLEEATKFISAHLNPPPGTEIVISRPRTNGRSKVRFFIDEVEKSDHRSDKIAAIKKVREVIGGNNIGLSEAKWVIENWDDVKRCMKSSNTLPKFVDGIFQRP
jgi:hypothetical protein